MIILDKLLNKYSKEYLLKEIPNFKAISNKNKGSFFSLELVSKYIDLKSVDYSFENFAMDYPQYKKHKEIRTIYNIQMDGLNMGDLVKKYNCFPLIKDTKDGFNFNTNDYEGKLDIIKYFFIDIDLSDFVVVPNDKTIEIFNNEMKIGVFKERYKIESAAQYDKKRELWSLNLSGLMGYWIKNFYCKN